VPDFQHGKKAVKSAFGAETSQSAKRLLALFAVEVFCRGAIHNMAGHFVNLFRRLQRGETFCQMRNEISSDCSENGSPKLFLYFYFYC